MYNYQDFAKLAKYLNQKMYSTAQDATYALRNTIITVLGFLNV